MINQSPMLARGLNLGRQFYWLEQCAPAVWSRCTQILTYAQYWAWRFCGTASSELTSLGCHTDLWRPLEQMPSQLAARRGWAERVAPIRKADETLGTIGNAWVRCGLPANCRVVCGIHDSNASLLAHALDQPRGAAFTVVSSGTWTVIFAPGSPVDCLKEDQDMLANIDACGQPVATARFAGGREYQALSGSMTTGADVNGPALQRLLQQQLMAMPAFADAGPFAGRIGFITGELNSDQERAAVASLYLALMTDLLLDRLDARGDVLLDGPLATDPVFSAALAGLRQPRQRVVCSADKRQGACVAALHLAGFALPDIVPPTPVEPGAATQLLPVYRARWRERLQASPTAAS